MRIVTAHSDGLFYFGPDDVGREYFVFGNEILLMDKEDCYEPETPNADQRESEANS